MLISEKWGQASEFEVVEVEWCLWLKTEYDLKNFHLLWNFCCQPPKCIADSMKNSSKVLIFYFASFPCRGFYNCTYIAKSELWNNSSYIGLPFIFEVGSQPFRVRWKILRSRFQFSISNVIWPQQPQIQRHDWWILKRASNYVISYLISNTYVDPWGHLPRELK